MTDQAIRDLKNTILTAINDVLAAEPENFSIARGTIDGKDFYKVERPIGVVEMDTAGDPPPPTGWQDALSALKKLVAECDAAFPTINGMIGLQFARTGRQYDGPIIDVDAARAVIAKLEGPLPPSPPSGAE